ncbi:protein PFC0760c-like isoform X1 [Microplitis mediator]|uniref:protein PFC0760c-like isoform X1 n=2 Tax=Microplitis mediator TaxID=375433 RepID=UPI0025543638|nr:protein PFC0760c-like isoform X1 [Microplitis mediator]
MSKQQNRWAGVVYDKNKKAAVPVHSIQRFNPLNYVAKKFYKLSVDGTTKNCYVLGVRDTKEAVQKELLAKRSSLPPPNLIESASDTSDLSQFKLKSKNKNNLASSGKGFNQQILELNQSSVKRQYDKDNAKEKMNPKKPKFDEKFSNSPPERPKIPTLNKQTDKRIQIKRIETISAPSMSPGSKDNEKSAAKPSKNETYGYITHLKEQLNMNKEEIENQKNKIKQLEKENEKLKNDVIEQNIKIIELLRNHTGNLLAKESSKIGQLNEEKDQVYISEERLMDRGLFELAMSSQRPSIFINTVAPFFFDGSTLLQSTVTGSKSKRSVEEIQPNKLDPIILRQMRDFYNYYLQNSIFTKKLEPSQKDRELGKSLFYLGRFIARLKNPSSKKKSNSSSKKKKKDASKNDDKENDDNKNDDREDDDFQDDDSHEGDRYNDDDDTFDDVATNVIGDEDDLDKEGVFTTKEHEENSEELLIDTDVE